ncbi:MAG: exodeoxyribonuclease III [Planctomycetaceae bacterium]|jgi:exodeoxyribonuclease-3|nr:exodeoxyribonuclease III [Planctomycetaceae bacterium]
MKLISWNVNGLRACIKKGFIDNMNSLNADVICVQETKMQRGQAEFELAGYREYWNSAAKKGYSGTAVFCRHEPIDIQYDIPDFVDVYFGNKPVTEGRVIMLEFAAFKLVNVYTPNSQPELQRLEHRLKWQDAFRDYIVKLDKTKPVVICGDLNVAHNEIDLTNPKANRHSAGFTDEERNKMTELLDAGLTDTFRKLYPDKREAYTWWSNFARSRERNVGWRIDYFLVSNRLMTQVKNAGIFPQITGSDHCPVGIEM